MKAFKSNATNETASSQPGTSTSQNAASNTGATTPDTSEEKLAKAQRVREMCGVTFEEARAALELSGYDVLDAVVLLERQGKTAQQAAHYTTADAAQPDEARQMSQAQSDYENSTKHDSFEETCARLWAWVKRVFKKSVEISFVAERNGSKILSVPLLLLIVLVIFAFWITIPLFIVSLFFDFRYHFDGIGTVTVDINEVTRKVSDAADTLKKDVVDGHHAATTGDAAPKDSDATK